MNVQIICILCTFRIITVVDREMNQRRKENNNKNNNRNINQESYRYINNDVIDFSSYLSLPIFNYTHWFLWNVKSVEWNDISSLVLFFFFSGKRVHAVTIVVCCLLHARQDDVEQRISKRTHFSFQVCTSVYCCNFYFVFTYVMHTIYTSGFFFIRLEFMSIGSHVYAEKFDQSRRDGLPVIVVVIAAAAAATASGWCCSFCCCFFELFRWNGRR